ncbi:MAG: hypothetical protein J3Q66DRAFT_425935 [Benniella sp.]|nr:MAG: hypothetical protein J3Q66DRAFT_425935 [Benniella sp.]
MQPKQAFRCRSSGKPANIPTSVDPKTGELVVLWNDVQRAFKNAESIRKENDMLPFLKDENLEEITPQRIAHHPDDVLEVDIGDTSHMLPLLNDGNLENITGVSTLIQIVGVLSIAENNTTKQALSGYSRNMTQGNHSVLAHYQSINPALQVLMSGQTAIMDSMIQNFDRLQIEMDKNKELQAQLVTLQRQMDEKQQQLYQSQQETKEEILKRQQEMLEMQQRALDRLAIIQNSVQKLATQNYELHEYPIPRLFIVLPITLGVSDRIKSIFCDQFRLYFLCECGTHTMTENTTIPHQIHLAKHEGYDLEKPTAFFERYGSYVLALLHMIKYGITMAGIIVPPLANSKIVDGIDTAQKHLDYLRKNITPLVDSTINFLNDAKGSNGTGSETTLDHSELDQLEALEGADLRQLDSYLKVKDQGRILGNLYRIVTSEGHVKWVCFDHYQATYREAAIKQLRDVVGINHGSYTEETGSIKIDLATGIQARQFYDAMAKARCIQELEITFKWDATMDDLQEFAMAVTKANVINLTVNGAHLKRPALDVVNRSRRFDPIMRLASNSRIQSLNIKGFDRFFVRISRSALTSSPKLRAFSAQSELPLKDKFKSVSNFVKFYSGLTTFEVQLHQDVLITKTVSDILSKLPKLESLSIDQWTRSFTASIIKGRIQYVVLTARRLDNFTPDDLRFTLKQNVNRLAVWFYPNHQNENQLSNILHTPEFIRMQLKNKHGNTYLEVAATPEWKLQDLVEIAASKFCENHGSLRVECKRLVLTMNPTKDGTQKTDITIVELHHVRYDDVEFMTQRHLTRLEIRGSPRKEGADQLSRIFRHCPALIQVQIGNNEKRSTASTDLDLTLWDIVKLAETNTLRLQTIEGISQGKIKDILLAINRLEFLDSEDHKNIREGYFARLAISYTENFYSRLPVTLQALELGHIRVALKRKQYLATLEWKLHDLLEMVISETPEKPESLSLDCPRLSLTANLSQGKISCMAVTVEQVNLLDFDDLTFIQQSHLTRLTISKTLKIEEKDRLADVLRHSRALKLLEIKYQKERDSAIGNAIEIKFLDLVTLVTSNISSSLESISIGYHRVTLTSSVEGGKIKDTAMKAKQLSDLDSDDLAVIQLGYLRLLEIHDAPLKTDEARLAEVLRVSMTNFHIRVGRKEERLPVITEHEMNLWDIVKMATSNTLCRIESLKIDYWKLSVTTGIYQNKVQDVVLSIDRLDDLVPGDLDIKWGTFTKLLIRHTPQENDEDRLNILKTAGLSFLQTRHQRGGRLALLAACEQRLQCLLDMAVSETPGELESFSIVCQRLSMAVSLICGKTRDAFTALGSSRGVVRKVDMTITTLGDLSTDDFAFIQHVHLSRLTIRQISQEADGDRLIDIMRSSPSLNHLQLGCAGESSLSVVDLVISTRDGILQERDSYCLRTFELMDKGLVPFDILASCDDKLHVQSHISFPEDSSPFDMRTWIRFKRKMAVKDEHGIRDFVRRYGWSAVFIDGGVASTNLPNILEEISSERSSQLESLWISCGSEGMELDSLNKIMKQSLHFKDVGLYLNPENDDQYKIAQPLLSRHGAILSKLHIYGNPSERWSCIASSFPDRKCFPALMSFEICPDSYVKLPLSCTRWIMVMVSDTLRGLITQAYAQTTYKIILDEMAYHRSSGLSTNSWTTLENIALRNIQFLSEDWERLFRVIDISRLKHLDLQASNFSATQFKLLVNHISCSDKSEVPLRTLNITGTDLDTGSDSMTFNGMQLREKAPLAKLIKV